MYIIHRCQDRKVPAKHVIKGRRMMPSLTNVSSASEQNTCARIKIVLKRHPTADGVMRINGKKQKSWNVYRGDCR